MCSPSGGSPGNMGKFRDLTFPIKGVVISPWGEHNYITSSFSTSPLAFGEPETAG